MISKVVTPCNLKMTRKKPCNILKFKFFIFQKKGNQVLEVSEGKLKRMLYQLLFLRLQLLEKTLKKE